jgi:hypothetical protein
MARVSSCWWYRVLSSTMAVFGWVLHVSVTWWRSVTTSTVVGVMRRWTSSTSVRATMWLSSALSYRFEAVEIAHHWVNSCLRGPHYVESDGFLRSVWRAPLEYDLKRLRLRIINYLTFCSRVFCCCNRFTMFISISSVDGSTWLAEAC